MKRKESGPPQRVTAEDVQTAMDYVFLFGLPVPVDRPPELQAKWEALTPAEQLDSILDHARRSDRIKGTRFEAEIVEDVQRARAARRRR